MNRSLYTTYSHPPSPDYTTVFITIAAVIVLCIIIEELHNKWK